MRSYRDAGKSEEILPHLAWALRRMGGRRTVEMPRRRKLTRPFSTNPRRIFFDIEWSSAKRREGRVPTFVGKTNEGVIKISMPPEMAAKLMSDMVWHARGAPRKPHLVIHCEIGRALNLLAKAGLTGREYLKEEIRHELRKYGTGLQNLANALVEAKEKEWVSKRDLVLDEAERQGYQKKIFYSQHKQPKLLKLMLLAWLVEFSLEDKGVLWKKAGFMSPVAYIKKQLATQRSLPLGERRGIPPLFKYYLGPPWRYELQQVSSTIPPALQSLFGK